MINLDELERLAKVATQSRWMVSGYQFSSPHTIETGAILPKGSPYGAIACTDLSNDTLSREQEHANAAHIAAACPEVLLALIERIRGAERQVAVLKHAHKMLMGQWPAVALSGMSAAHEYIAGALEEAENEVPRE